VKFHIQQQSDVKKLIFLTKLWRNKILSDHISDFTKKKSSPTSYAIELICIHIVTEMCKNAKVPDLAEYFRTTLHFIANFSTIRISCWSTEHGPVNACPKMLKEYEDKPIIVDPGKKLKT
jgi:hypothetical protein